MSVWMKRLTILFSIVAIIFMVGCGSSLEKPLSKEEAVEIQEDEVEKKTSADVKLPNLNTKQDDKSEGTENDSESKSVSKEVAEKNEEEEQTADLEAASNESHSNEKSNDSTIAGNTSKAAESTTKEKSTNDNSNVKSSSDSSSKSNKTTSTPSKDTNKTNSKKTNKNESTDTSKNSSNEATNKEAENEPEAPKDTLIYSIVISANEVPLPPTEIEVKEGDSVLDVLIKITQEKRIQMDYRGGQGATAYVEGIDNVYEFDRGQGSGWMYRVNGIFPDRGAGVVPLLPGDKVEWLYTTDLGKDLGADLKPFRR